VTVSESQLHVDEYRATSAVDGEAADVTDETPGFDDAVDPAGDAEAEGSAEQLDADAAALEAAAPEEAAPEEELDVVEEFKRELRMLPGDWYVIHSYAGYENRVKTNLESRITSLNMEDYIFQIEVPTHQVIEIKSGKKTTVNEKVLPGYILVRMDLTDESWAVVRNTPGVTGFVGLSNRPSPLPLSEVAGLLGLLLLTESRRRARFAADGSLVLLRDQDREATPVSRPSPPRRGRRNTRSASRLPLWTGRSRRFRRP